MDHYGSSTGMPQSRLFRTLPLLTWLPDETIFSLASRYHVLSGNANSASTCLALYGHARQGSFHDVPARVGHLCDVFDGQLGVPETVIRERSIASFFYPFLDHGESTAWTQSMSEASATTFKVRLGLPSSQFGASFPLKACAECASEDLDRHGVAYWHNDHQFPGVWICLRHRLPLVYSFAKGYGLERFGWLLPRTAELRQMRLPAISKSRVDELARFVSSYLGQTVAFHFDKHRLVLTYRSGMKRAGLMSDTGRASQRQFGEALYTLISELDGCPDFSGLAKSEKRLAESFRRLLVSPLRGDRQHPLKHFLFILAVFGSWEEFWTCYCSAHSAGPYEVPVQKLPNERPLLTARTPDARKPLFLDLLRSGSHSVRSASLETGIAVQTGISWAAALDIKVIRRPKKLDDVSRDRLINYLRAGQDKAYVAARGAVSITTVTRLLFTVPGLHEAWGSARRLKTRDSHRAHWTNSIHAYGPLGVSEIRARNPAAYSWLYRHDKNWLDESMSLISTRTPTRCNRIDWTARDTMLSEKVAATIRAHRESNGDRHLTISQIRDQVPELKTSPMSLIKLPLTRNALSFR